MPTARYKFVRSGTSIKGFASLNSASTDALNAVSTWSGAQPGRSMKIVLDDDAQLVAELTWSNDDSVAGPNLDDECDRFGVERTFIQQ
jgi:hypothetical protein